PVVEPRATRSTSRPGQFGVAAAETLQDVLRHRARLGPGRPHLYFHEEDGRTATVTFGELFERVEAVARVLACRGVAPGDTVAIMLPTSLEFFYAFGGTLLAGGIPVPIYPPFRADRIEEYAVRQSAILQNAQARLLVTFRQAERVARPLAPRVPSPSGEATAPRLPDPPANPAEPAPVEHRARGEEIALLQYTSGSTGDPKGVILTHANLLANVRAIGEAVDIRPDDV